MFVGTKRLLSQIPAGTHILVDGNPIFPSHSIRNLGIHFDPHITFAKHIKDLSRKVNGKLMYINRMKNNFNKCTRINVVHTLILSQLSYGIKIWGAANCTQIARAQKLQNFAQKLHWEAPPNMITSLLILKSSAGLRSSKDTALNWVCLYTTW